MAQEFELVVVGACARHDRLQAMPDDCFHRREHRKALREYDEACKLVRGAFAAARGWRVARTPFNVRQLKTHIHARLLVGDYLDNHQDNWKVVDHPEFYRDGGRPSRPIGIISHTYCKDEKLIAAFAERQELSYEILPVQSWYFPGSTIPVLFTAAKK